jgi:hypothetical protein
MAGYKCLSPDDVEDTLKDCVDKDLFIDRSCTLQEALECQDTSSTSGSVPLIDSINYVCLSPRHFVRLVDECTP